MTKLKNLVGSPFDLQTLNGPAVIHAFGTLEAEFDSAYLQLIALGGSIVVVEQEDEADLSDLRSEYLEIAGKDADKRWSDKRLADEIAKLKA